jgi:hypothetical protein
MRINKTAHLLAAGILGISMLACNLGKGPGPVGTTDSPATQAPSGNSGASSSACDNPLLPIKAGATWTYKLTGGVSDTFTRSILSVDGSSFTDQDVFGSGATRQGKWNCDNGSLIALDPSQGASASVNTSNISADFQTTELSGVTLPAAINPGDTWTQSITLEGNETINGQTIPAKNQTTNTCTAIGVESVTVEAGTFDAMHFDCQTSINITITMANTEIPTSINVTSSAWHAVNIGMVKTVTTGEGLNSTIELVSYTIP